MSPLRRRYDVFFRSTTVAFKAIRCRLRLKISDKAPKNWATKRNEIDERIMKFTRCPKKEATIEEISIDEIDENDIGFLQTENDKPEVKALSRPQIDTRRNDISEVLEYNILKRQSDDNIQLWKSYPGISNIVDIARKVIEEGDMSNIGKLAEMMQVHES